LGLSRRRFVISSLATLATAPPLALLYAWGVEPHWTEIVRRDMPIDGLPSELDGRTLVQLSDLHVGPRVDDAHVIDALTRAAALDPDIVVITGDWISYRGEAQLAQLERVLAHLPRGRLGTFGVLGNHDYGWGWSMLDVGDRVTSIATNAGAKMLRNESAEVAGLTIFGVEDLWGPKFAPEALLNGASSRRAAIALCHNPDAADRRVWAGFKGWILSGHTHGGQCKAPFLPPPILPVKNRRYTAGEFDLFDGRRLYINRGIGHLIRVRFNVRPEITAFTLRRAV
jgi:uncharacterized protein